MNKKTMNIIMLGAAVLGASIVVTRLYGCKGNSNAEETLPRVPPKAIVAESGMKITFPEGHPGLKLLRTTTAKKGSVLISVSAPARVVASITSAGTDGERIVLFESPDATSLYSQYKQARSNVELAAKNLARVRDMFENRAATAKDLYQAETDEANAHAAKAEFESKLRAAGFNPAELGNVRPGTIWLISDVPETQLNEVQKGEEVDVMFSSFPDKKFVGRADTIGDVVDPITRTVKVRVIMRNPQGKFLPGMFARVDFGDSLNGVIILPPSTVVTVEQEDYVFVETAPGEFHRRQVTLANSSGSQIVVLKGLDDGEKVVTEGAMLLKGLSFGF